jgi:hypothetical protein
VNQPTAEDVRAAYPNFEITLSGDGTWAAVLTTAAPPKPLITAATLAGLVEALNDYISGMGDQQ